MKHNFIFYSVLVILLIAVTTYYANRPCGGYFGDQAIITAFREVTEESAEGKVDWERVSGSNKSRTCKVLIRGTFKSDTENSKFQALVHCEKNGSCQVENIEVSSPE